MIFKLSSKPKILWHLSLYGLSPSLRHHLCRVPIQGYWSSTYVSEMGIKETKPKILWDLSYGIAVNIKYLKRCHMISYIRRLFVWWCQCSLYYKSGINNTLTKNERCFFNNRKLVQSDFCKHLQHCHPEMHHIILKSDNCFIFTLKIWKYNINV